MGEQGGVRRQQVSGRHDEVSAADSQAYHTEKHDGKEVSEGAREVPRGRSREGSKVSKGERGLALAGARSQRGAGAMRRETGGHSGHSRWGSQVSTTSSEPYLR